MLRFDSVPIDEDTRQFGEIGLRYGLYVWKRDDFLVYYGGEPETLYGDLSLPHLGARVCGVSPEMLWKAEESVVLDRLARSLGIKRRAA